MLLVMLLRLVCAGGLCSVCRGCSRSCGRYSRSRSLCEHSSGKQGGERCSNELLFHGGKTLRGCLTVSRLACRDYMFNASSSSVLTRDQRNLRGKLKSWRDLRRRMGAAIASSFRWREHHAAFGARRDRPIRGLRVFQ